ncbi:MAG: hypothetical protein JWO13_1189 [Acidobacteriales bacterium]|nr:hypothetical protein [Terriglobales bacterium]
MVINGATSNPDCNTNKQVNDWGRNSGGYGRNQEKSRYIFVVSTPMANYHDPSSEAEVVPFGCA